MHWRQCAHVAVLVQLCTLLLQPPQVAALGSGIPFDPVVPYVWDTHRIGADPAYDPGFPEWLARAVAKGDEGANLGCPDWNGYFWPQASFLAGEMWKRAKRADLNDPDQRRQVELLLNQTSYLMCLPKFDPRKGTKWSEHVANWMKKAARSPGITFPTLPHEPFFDRQEMADMVVFDGCMVWAKDMACDVWWWGKELRGNKAPNELCWDNVPWPGYSFAALGGSDQQGRPAPPPNVRQRLHPEYAECMEHLLNDTVFDQLCPEGGHLRDGVFDVTYWGDGVNSRRGQEEISQCTEMMGTPVPRGFGTPPAFPYSPVVGLW